MQINYIYIYIFDLYWPLSSRWIVYYKNAFLYANGVKTCKFKAKDSEITPYLSADFTIAKMKKLKQMNISTTFQFLMILLIPALLKYSQIWQDEPWSQDDKQCIAKPALFDSNLGELDYYPFKFILDCMCRML